MLELFKLSFECPIARNVSVHNFGGYFKRIFVDQLTRRFEWPNAFAIADEN